MWTSLPPSKQSSWLFSCILSILKVVLKRYCSGCLLDVCPVFGHLLVQNISSVCYSHADIFAYLPTCVWTSSPNSVWTYAPTSAWTSAPTSAWTSAPTYARTSAPTSVRTSAPTSVRTSALTSVWASIFISV